MCLCTRSISNYVTYTRRVIRHVAVYSFSHTYIIESPDTVSIAQDGRPLSPKLHACVNQELNEQNKKAVSTDLFSYSLTFISAFNFDMRTVPIETNSKSRPDCLILQALLYVSVCVSEIGEYNYGSIDIYLYKGQDMNSKYRNCVYIYTYIIYVCDK